MNSPERAAVVSSGAAVVDGAAVASDGTDVVADAAAVVGVTPVVGGTEDVALVVESNLTFLQPAVALDENNLRAIDHNFRTRFVLHERLDSTIAQQVVSQTFLKLPVFISVGKLDVGVLRQRFQPVGDDLAVFAIGRLHPIKLIR